MSTTLKTFVSVAALSLSTMNVAEAFENIFVFGDSLSDQGNLAAVSEEFQFLYSPPYNAGRFTNGLTAVEILADNLELSLSPSYHLSGQQLGNNYAIAGARAATQEPIDLDTQVNSFLGLNGFTANPENLYVVMIGGNDIRLARDTNDGNVVITAATNVAANIEKLIGAGAETILVANAADISEIPETDLIVEASGVEATYRIAKAYSKLYNESLEDAVDALKDAHPEVKIKKFDLARFIRHTTRKAERYGFTNSEDACWSPETGGFTIGCENGVNMNSYIYFDNIHPTEPVHAAAAEKMTKIVKKKRGRRGH